LAKNEIPINLNVMEVRHVHSTELFTSRDILFHHNVMLGFMGKHPEAGKEGMEI